MEESNWVYTTYYYGTGIHGWRFIDQGSLHSLYNNYIPFPHNLILIHKVNWIPFVSHLYVLAVWAHLILSRDARLWDEVTARNSFTIHSTTQGHRRAGLQHITEWRRGLVTEGRGWSLYPWYVHVMVPCYLHGYPFSTTPLRKSTPCTLTPD